MAASGQQSTSADQQGASGGFTRPPVDPFREETTLSVSSDEEEVGSDFTAALREQQAQWDLEFNTKHNSIAQQRKDDEAAAARRKKERRRAKEQQLMEEAKQKHLDRMKALQAETRKRSSRNSSQGDNDVFEPVSRQSRPPSRVAFSQQQTSP